MTTHSPLRLDDWGLIHAHGDDAARFLQSQLTQDIESLPEGGVRLAGWCSAKGRLLASFVVWRDGPGSYWLACSRDLLEPTLKRLRMFVLRLKCKLDDATESVSMIALAGSAALQWLKPAPPPGQATAAHGGWLVALPPEQGELRWWLVIPISAPLPEGLPGMDPLVWRRLELQSGVVRIVQATVERFVPQMVNLELVGGVDFQKGCYPGQEVVARSQYRGTLKRRLQLFSADAEMQPGQEVFHDADPGQPAGMVALAAPGSADGRPMALVEVKLAALETGTLSLGSASGPAMQWLPLPYPLPDEAKA